MTKRAKRQLEVLREVLKSKATKFQEYLQIQLVTKRQQKKRRCSHRTVIYWLSRMFRC